MEQNKLIRRFIRFSGRVQGVGFRYVAYQAANAVGASGWVRNEYDGTVTMEIQGTEEQLDMALQALTNGRYLRIDRADSRAIAVVPNEKGFRVRY